MTAAGEDFGGLLDSHQAARTAGPGGHMINSQQMMGKGFMGSGEANEQPGYGGDSRNANGTPSDNTAANMMTA